MVNGLNSNIVIIRSTINLPITYISPRKKIHSSCKCLAAKNSCSSTCGCKGCKNPHGNRVMLGKRKREVHVWQTYDTASTTISLGRGQTLTNGGWSTLESIILIQVICFIDRELLMDLETFFEVGM